MEAGIRMARLHLSDPRRRLLPSVGTVTLDPDDVPKHLPRPPGRFHPPLHFRVQGRHPRDRFASTYFVGNLKTKIEVVTTMKKENGVERSVAGRYFSLRTSFW